MSDKSGITWTDATWNPITGCTKVSAACKNCYAERDWARLTHIPTYAGRKFTDVACHSERLDQPLRWQRSRRVFVNSMSDLFHEDVPDEFIDRVFAVMALAKRHVFQVLTKRPERMLTYLSRLGKSAKLLDTAARTVGYTLEFQGRYLVSWPIPNVWLGVSIEDQATADDRIPLLLQAPAAIRWISAEPLLGPVVLGDVPVGMNGPLRPHADTGLPRLDWCVVGGESSAKARPMKLDWARNLRSECREAKVPFFFKQTGLWLQAEEVEDTRNIPGDRLQYFPELDATFIKTKGGGSDLLDGRQWQQWPRGQVGTK